MSTALSCSHHVSRLQIPLAFVYLIESQRGWGQGRTGAGPMDTAASHETGDLWPSGTVTFLPPSPMPGLQEESLHHVRSVVEVTGLSWGPSEENPPPSRLCPAPHPSAPLPAGVPSQPMSPAGQEAEVPEGTRSRLLVLRPETQPLKEAVERNLAILFSNPHYPFCLPLSVALELFGRHLETAGETAIIQLKRLALGAGDPLAGGGGHTGCFWFGL